MTRIHWRFWERRRDDCTSVEPLLSLYADEMTSGAEAQRVAAHLPDCEDCRQALQWMQITRQVILSRPVAAPPADLCARIARAIADAEAPRPAPRLLTLRPALGYGFSIALLAVVGGGVIWKDTHSLPVAVGPALAHQPVIAAVPPRPAHVAAPAAPIIAGRPPAPPTRLHARRPAAPAVRPDLMAAAVVRRAMPPKVRPIFAPPASYPFVAVAPPRQTLLARVRPVVPQLPSVIPRRPSPAAQSGTQVASAPPIALPSVPVPSVRVSAPSVTPDQVRTASFTTPSLNDTLHGIALYIHDKASLTGRGVAANSRTVASDEPLATADSSGTLPFTEGPVR